MKDYTMNKHGSRDCVALDETRSRLGAEAGHGMTRQGRQLMLKLFIVTSVLSSCAYSADFQDCAVRCDDSAGCPDDLTCGAEGLCRAAEAEACVLPNDGTGGTITHASGRTIHTFSAVQSGSTFTPPTGMGGVELLVVAGGGGGGSTRGGGGGGAGGLVYMASYTITLSSYSVTVGNGGGPATNGNDSSFGPIVAIGGGAGKPSGIPNGGSGGGSAHGADGGGTGSAGQGNRGGANGFDSGSMTFTGAGGGGAGGQGAVGTPSAGGAGGPGLAYAISGVQVFYAGGGGGGDQDLGSNGLSPGVGGMGGGGDGGLNAVGKDGVDGTGGGGGGGGGGPDTAFNSGGRGGAGIVIISYPTQLD